MSKQRIRAKGQGERGCHDFSPNRSMRNVQIIFCASRGSLSFATEPTMRFPAPPLGFGLGMRDVPALRLRDERSIPVRTNLHAKGLTATVNHVFRDSLSGVPEGFGMKHEGLLFRREVNGVGPTAFATHCVQDNAGTPSDFGHFIGLSNRNDFGIFGQRTSGVR